MYHAKVCGAFYTQCYFPCMQVMWLDCFWSFGVIYYHKVAMGLPFDGTFHKHTSENKMQEPKNEGSILQKIWPSLKYSKDKYYSYVSMEHNKVKKCICIISFRK